MEELRWNLIKNEHLKRTRGVSFKEIVKKGEIVGIISHPKRKNQNIILYVYKKYVWVIPYVEKKKYFFLKTLYPSRKLTKLYRQGDL